MKLRRGSLLSAALVMSLFLIHSNASVGYLSELPDAERVGSGKLTWWGMTVYHATLFAEQGRYQPDRPHALKIDYKLGFSREQLARTSVKEIERLFGELDQREQSIQRLASVFRDVDKGEHIIGIHYPGKGAAFYSDSLLLGHLDDARLAEAFFAIWLDSGTRRPELRRQLLGLAE